MTQIMVVKEKHGKRLFVIADRAAYARVATKLLKERSEEGWFQSLADIEKEEQADLARRVKNIDPAFLELTPEQISELPESLRISAQGAQEDYRIAVARSKRAFIIEREFAEGMDQLLASDAPAELQVTNERGRTENLAITLLQLREDYEYEGYSIETAEEA